MAEQTEFIEPLLDPSQDRPAIFPIKYHDIWKAYKKQESLIWHSHEVVLTKDANDWKNLNDNERHFLEYILAFFASSDKIVAQNLAERFSLEIQIPEVKFFYDFQKMMENIHSEVYSKLLDTYIKDENKKTRLFRAIETIPCVKKKAQWALKWINSNENFALRMIAFAAVEGILFSGSFCAIYWLNERRILPGLAKANDFIARDEGLHTKFACHLYNNYIVNKPTYEQVSEVIKDAVNHEIEFITEALPCRLLGMNSVKMIKYIKFVANRLMLQLGHSEPLYTSKEAGQVFPHMDRICLREKSNFFEDDPSGYRKFDETVNLNNGVDEEDPYANL